MTSLVVKMRGRMSIALKACLTSCIEWVWRFLLLCFHRVHKALCCVCVFVDVFVLGSLMGKGHGYNGVPWNWKYCRFCNTNSWNNCKLMTYQCDFFFRCGWRSICFLCRFFQHFLNFIVIVCVSLRHWWNTIAVTCPNCSYGQAYFMQIQIRSADEPMTTFYKCCNIDCSHRWKENWILGLAPTHFCWVWFFYCQFMHMPSMILHYPAHDIGMTLKSQEQPGSFLKICPLMFC